MKVGVIQLKCEINSYQSNVEHAIQMIDSCIEEKCDLICLPEAFSTTLDFRRCKEVSESIPGKTSELLCGKAKEDGIHLIAGILERKNEDVYSSAVLINHRGEITGTYRRMHLFQLEKRFIKNGDSLTVFETPIGRIGIIIGYDINFPEACRVLFEQKAEIIVCPTQIPDTFAYATRILSLARAIENSCYFILASSVGENIPARFKYMGNSLIARSSVAMDPYSTDYIRENEIIAQADDNETIIYGNLDLRRLRREQDVNPHYNDRVLKTTLLSKLQS